MTSHERADYYSPQAGSGQNPLDTCGAIKERRTAFPLRTKNGQQNPQNNRLTGKAPYKSVANLTPTMEHETEVMPSYSMADIGYPRSFMAFGKTRLKLVRKGSESPEDVGFQSRPRNRSNPT